MAELPARVGLLGGGVIGGGWAARYSLNGVAVRVYDPDPEMPRRLGEVLDNARAAYEALVGAPAATEGDVSFVATPEEAVESVEIVHESAPERLELKRDLLAAAGRAAAPGTLFFSSTSGLLPSLLQERMPRPEAFAVAHPFNPVYLLPLVELCGGGRTASETVERGAAVFTALGMRPLVVRKEIGGFIADRLLEALWREALWLVNDGIATVTEVDDAVRFGAGLRWSFMGTFLTYRIAGGEGGMRHFLEQFGPTLELPWTKLMDVPDLDDRLVDAVTAQSDEQAAGRSIRELERWRDQTLVAVIHGLAETGAGAGTVLDEYRRLLADRAGR